MGKKSKTSSRKFPEKTGNILNKDADITPSVPINNFCLDFQPETTLEKSLLLRSLDGKIIPRMSNFLLFVYITNITNCCYPQTKFWSSYQLQNQIYSTVNYYPHLLGGGLRISQHITSKSDLL